MLSDTEEYVVDNKQSSDLRNKNVLQKDNNTYQIIKFERKSARKN